MTIRPINAIIRALTDLQERDHNDLTNRDTTGAHSQSSISGLDTSLNGKVEKSGSITQIATRNHNDLQNRDAVNAHNNITQITTRNHNDLQNRDAADAHSNITQITTRNHNDLQNRDAADAHPSESVGVLSSSSMFPQDIGLTWDAGTIVGFSFYVLESLGNGIALAGDGGNGKIYRSTDYGLTWSAGAEVGADIESFAYLGNGIVLAGDGGNGKIYRSTDYGLTWSVGTVVGSAIYGLAYLGAYLGNGIALAGDAGNGKIYRSTDYGVTWDTGTTVGSATYRLAYAGNGIVIYGDLGTGKIYRSTDYGVTWNAGTVVGNLIGGLAYLGNGIVIAGDASNGKIYRSDIAYKLDETQAAPIVVAIKAYASGTVYSLTATPALLDFGTTDPSITINKPGTYLLKARVNLKYNAATFAANQTVTLKLRRTNNTLADISNSSTALTTGIITTLTETFAIVELPDIIYTTSNADDTIQIWGDVSVVPGAGSLDAVEASIMATRLY